MTSKLKILLKKVSCLYSKADGLAAGKGVNLKQKQV